MHPKPIKLERKVVVSRQKFSVMRYMDLNQKIPNIWQKYQKQVEQTSLKH